MINDGGESVHKDKKDFSYDDAVELTGHGCYNYLLLATCCIISNAFALDMFGFSIVVAASNCDLKLSISETGILASAPFAGLLFAFPWGYYADTQGRKRALLLSTSIGFVFSALSSLSPNWQFMLVLKLIGSSFSTSSYSMAITYLGESTGSQRRTQYLYIVNSMNLASEIVSFSLAYFILPLTFNVTLPWLSISYRSWRLFTFIIALPLGIGAFMLMFLQESPKFLAVKGQTDKALEVLRKMYETNGGKRNEYQVKGLKYVECDVSATESFWSSLVKQTVPLFKPPLLLRTLQLYYLIVICCTTNNAFLMWFPTMVNMFFNTLAGNATGVGFCEGVVHNNSVFNEVNDHTCNETISSNTIYFGILLGIFFTILNLAVSRFASWRRSTLVFSFLVAALSSILVGVITHPIPSIIFFALLQTTAIGIGSVISYFVDLFPTSHRGLATSLGLMVARLASLASVNMVGAVITHYCHITFYCWAIFVASGIMVTLFLPAEHQSNLNSQ